MKKPEYEKGPKARENFERAMTSLFRVPKAAVSKKLKKNGKKGKD
jgi:hypothetical protein